LGDVVASIGVIVLIGCVVLLALSGHR